MDLRRFAILLAALFVFSTISRAQKADVAFVAGGSFSSDAKVTGGILCITSPCPTLTISSHHQYFLEGTGALRLANFKLASLHVELPVAAIPSAITGGGNITLTSIYVTPSLRIKLAPGAAISPFASVGGGWAHYSILDVTTNKGALQFGGGVDIKLGLPLLAFRAEVRDFVTGQPDFGILVASVTRPGTLANNDRRHNVLAGGGIVLRF
jgi:hypothetical protein